MDKQTVFFRTKRKGIIMGRSVVGQTGKCVLSVEGVLYNLSRERTVRYRYVKHPVGERTYWYTEVIGPFHSRYYGTCAFGTTRKRAKAALQDVLGREFGYMGVMMFSDVDTSDTVGFMDQRLLDDAIKNVPITATF